MPVADEMPRPLAPAAVKRRLSESGEIALLDLREHGQHGAGHPLFAVPLPYSRLELEAPRLLPCRRTPIVLLDQGDGVAEMAARRLVALGYERLHTVAGGAPGWAAAGYRLFQGVNVPSKTLGELVEAQLHTPSLTAKALSAMRAAGAAMVQLDGRPIEEYQRMTIPGARCCPNAELAHRLDVLAPDPQTPVVVSCAGRTRSLIGAQSLIVAGLPNPVFALENGTQGWVLAKLALEHGADRRYPEALDQAALERSRRRGRELIEAYEIPRLDQERLAAWAADEERSLYCLDVRTPEEYAAGHHPLARSAPGGQLVQATDQWIAVRGARVALFDDTGLRAALTALWLRAMGHRVWVAESRHSDRRNVEPRPEQPRPEPLPLVTPTAVRTGLDGNGLQIVDLRSATRFRASHLAGALWSIRPRLAGLGLAPTRPVVLTADSPAIAALAAIDLGELGHRKPVFLPADEVAWQAAGLAVETGKGPSDTEAIDTLFFVHDRHAGNTAAMRAYLAWEQALVGQLDAEERAIFDLAPLRQGHARV